LLLLLLLLFFVVVVDYLDKLASIQKKK